MLEDESLWVIFLILHTMTMKWSTVDTTVFVSSNASIWLCRRKHSLQLYLFLFLVKLFTRCVQIKETTQGLSSLNIANLANRKPDWLYTNASVWLKKSKARVFCLLVILVKSPGPFGGMMGSETIATIHSGSFGRFANVTGAFLAA